MACVLSRWLSLRWFECRILREWGHWKCSERVATLIDDALDQFIRRIQSQLRVSLWALELNVCGLSITVS
jgi:hypothetical protein